ncbi:MAG: alpha-galactosidase, partial [Candidatus Aminicenantes bacterium]|nr:alpha-galactosidase [Candidatus Aminicenantes bacterium]
MQKQRTHPPLSQTWFLALFLSCFSSVSAAEAPPNNGAIIQLKNQTITFTYESERIFFGVLEAGNVPFTAKTILDESNDRISQILLLTTKRENESLTLRGIIRGGIEAFPCEVDRRDRGLAVVRHSSGPSHSLLNRAVYDRARDWVFSVDHNPRVRITPESGSTDENTFAVEITGREIALRFRPLFYQKHKGLSHFKPWTYQIWADPVVGWCSWFAYLTEITEDNIKKTADIIAEKLLPYGYEYLQIDDGYQQGTGVPELWLEPNKKFPGGLKALADYIKRRGLKPGIWTNVAFKQWDYGEEHRDLFVRDEDGSPHRGNWIGLSIDGSNPEALKRLIRPVYKGLKDMGWQYFKVDALRHLRNEGYNSVPEHFKQKNADRETAFRDLVQAIREEIGREHFMLGCWGIRPELIGLIDGCRIGTDGYSYAGLAQYNSFNNVVWLNDPDHIELSREEAYRSTMVTSLTGSLFLLTDKPELYRNDSEFLRPARQAAPVLHTRPGQIYEIDPSRILHLDQVGSEVSGSGPRLFDASRTPNVQLYLLEINRPFENWILLGRTGGNEQHIPFAELGLDPASEYYVYEFWSERLMGSFRGSFEPGPVNPRTNCQLFCIRKKTGVPGILATDRHISCGGYDLQSVQWKDNTLTGESRVVPSDPYTISLIEPEGYEFTKVECRGGTVKEVRMDGSVRRITLVSPDGTQLQWTVKYRKT